MDSITSRVSVSRLSSTRLSHGSPAGANSALESLSTNTQHDHKGSARHAAGARTARAPVMDSVAQERLGRRSAPSALASATFEYTYSYYPAEEDEDAMRGADATRHEEMERTVNDMSAITCTTARTVQSDTTGLLLGTPLSPALHEGTPQPEQAVPGTSASNTITNSSGMMATPHLTPRESALQMSGHTPITFTHGGAATTVMAVAGGSNSNNNSAALSLQLRQRVAASRARLDKTDYLIARCTEAVGGRRDCVALLQHQLSQEQQRLVSYRERTTSMQAELRQGRDRRRVREELAMLADMYTEREIRLQALEQRRNALQELWAQLELLCGAAPHPDAQQAEGEEEEEEGAAQENSISEGKEEAKQQQQDKKEEEEEDNEEKEESAAREASQVSVLSQASASVLQGFLAGLLQEVETLAQICIQLPSPPVPVSHTTRRSQARRAASPDLRGCCPSKCNDDGDDDNEVNADNARASQAGFFSFFGGATEDHLSAKPLSTFLSCASRLQHGAWELEETLQLRARELATDAEEENLRRHCTHTLATNEYNDGMDRCGLVSASRSAARLTAPAAIAAASSFPSAVAAAAAAASNMYAGVGLGTPEDENEGESLGEPLRGTALMTPWAGDSAAQPGTSAEGGEDEDGGENNARMSLSLVMPDLTLSARRGSTGSGGGGSARAQAGAAPPPGSPRPHTPRGSLTNISAQQQQQQRGNGVARATRRTVTLPPLLYAYPRLPFLSHQLDLEQSKVQKEYEQSIERETEKRRTMVRRLKAAYKAQVEPPLRDALRALYEQRRTILHELAALGVTAATLQWQEQEELSGDALVQAARVGCGPGTTDYAQLCNAYTYNSKEDGEDGCHARLYGALPAMLEGSVRVRSVSRRQAAAQRAEEEQAHRGDDENGEEEEENVHMLLPAPLQASPLSMKAGGELAECAATATGQAMSDKRSHNHNNNNSTFVPQRYLRQLIVHTQDLVAAEASSTTSTTSRRRRSDEAPGEQDSTTASHGAIAEETAGRFSGGRLSDFCPRRSGTCETPPASSRGTRSSASWLRSSYGTSAHGSEPRSSATLAPGAATQAQPQAAAVGGERGGVGGAPHEMANSSNTNFYNNDNDESELHSAVPLARRAAPVEAPPPPSTPAASAREQGSAHKEPTSVRPSRVGRTAEKTQASAPSARRSSLSHQARKALHALRNAVKDTRTPLPPAAAAAAHNHSSNVSAGNGGSSSSAVVVVSKDVSTAAAEPPELLDAAAVKVTLCFAGPEAQRRRAREQAREQHARSLWVLREELARANEANFAAQAQLQELEAAYEAKRLQHAGRVREAAAKLAETKNLLRSVVAEHTEWVSIRDDMQAMLEQQAHRHRQHRHHRHISEHGEGEGRGAAGRPCGHSARQAEPSNGQPGDEELPHTARTPHVHQT